MRIVLGHGSFDVLHVGHVDYLRQCSAAGDTVVIALTGDEAIRFRKGEDRPIIPFSQRKTILESIRFVDRVVQTPYISHDQVANLLELVKAMKPDVFATIYDEFTAFTELFDRQQTELAIMLHRHLPISTTRIIDHIRSNRT